MAITSMAQTSVLKPNLAYFYLKTRHTGSKKVLLVCPRHGQILNLS